MSVIHFLYFLYFIIKQKPIYDIQCIELIERCKNILKYNSTITVIHSDLTIDLPLLKYVYYDANNDFSKEQKSILLLHGLCSIQCYIYTTMFYMQIILF